MVEIWPRAATPPTPFSLLPLSSPSVSIFSDALNHASIVDGARLAARGAGAALQIYPHGDLQALDAALAAAPPSHRKLIVSDSLFSMDGDYADVAGLARVKEKHKALLILDEAHATLVAGPSGGGAADAAGVAHLVDVHVGTLSKAFGAHGGFVDLLNPRSDGVAADHGIRHPRGIQSRCRPQQPLPQLLSGRGISSPQLSSD